MTWIIEICQDKNILNVLYYQDEWFVYVGLFF